MHIDREANNSKRGTSSNDQKSRGPATSLGHELARCQDELMTIDLVATVSLVETRLIEVHSHAFSASHANWR